MLQRSLFSANNIRIYDNVQIAFVKNFLLTEPTRMPTYIFDDVYGDQRPGSYSPRVIYGPQWGLWDPVGGTCWGCTLGTDLPIAIESENATMGTWHTVTVQPGGQVANLSVTFTGT